MNFYLSLLFCLSVLSEKPRISVKMVVIFLSLVPFDLASALLHILILSLFGLVDDSRSRGSLRLGGLLSSTTGTSMKDSSSSLMSLTRAETMLPPQLLGDCIVVCVWKGGILKEYRCCIEGAFSRPGIITRCPESSHS